MSRGITIEGDLPLLKLYGLTFLPLSLHPVNDALTIFMLFSASNFSDEQTSLHIYAMLV